MKKFDVVCYFNVRKAKETTKQLKLLKIGTDGGHFVQNNWISEAKWPPILFWLPMVPFWNGQNHS